MKKNNVLFLIFNFFLIVTAQAQTQYDFYKSELSASEIKFVEELNQFRTKNGDSVLEYSAYQNAEGKRYIWPVESTSNIDSKVTTTEHAFFAKIASLRKNNPIVVETFIGFSAAEYDKNVLKADLSAYTEAIITENKRKYGSNTSTLFISGATNEGIGLVYSPDVMGQDLLKTGIVSDQALAYEMKYGGQIAQGQDAIFLVDSYKDAKGQKSWEVKSSIEERSYNNFSSDRIHNASEVKMNVFEGGEIALREALEWLENRSSASFKEKSFSLNLFIGYEAAKAQKDKGPRAASELAQVLLRFPQLIPSNVKVNFYEAGKVVQGSIDLEQFGKTKKAKRLLDKNSEAYKKYVSDQKTLYDKYKLEYLEWYQKNQIQIEAKLRQLQAWVDFEQVVVKTLVASQKQNQSSLDRWLGVLNQKESTLPMDDLADRKSGLAQQSADLLSAKMNALESVLNQLKTAQVLSCKSLF